MLYWEVGLYRHQLPLLRGYIGVRFLKFKNQRPKSIPFHF